MGNEAMGRGLVEAGCTLVSAYPGTPSSEILGAVVASRNAAPAGIHLEWSINEKVAFETALAHSYTGKRAAVIMKQVGLNVAADPFTRSTYLGVKGGFVVVAADDPGPHSSQTEQDTRLFAMFAKAPVFDPSSPAEAREMVAQAFELSEKYELPVILRPTTRICHSRQLISSREPIKLERQADFEKNPGRWVATPAFLTGLHHDLNKKLAAISAEEGLEPVMAIAGHEPDYDHPCLIASGMAFANVFDLLEELDMLDKVDLYQVKIPFPLNKKFCHKIRENYSKILILEETDSVMEMQLAAHHAHGRLSAHVPGQGELTPDIIYAILLDFFALSRPEAETGAPPARGRRPSLCPGCPHRASFFAIKKTFPKGIFPSDIGCYTLGMNLGAVDTCHCMGACISQGAGFYHSYAHDGDDYPSIVVTIGDSTFFHAGIPALINAVIQKARIIVTILDNSTTAMTGQQPTPENGILADGSPGNRVFISDIVKACGVGFLREGDPYDLETFSGLLKEADNFSRTEGGVAVIIARHPCLMDKRNPTKHKRVVMTISSDCVGCGICVNQFECPAIMFDEDEKKASIDHTLCVDCGVCEQVCPTGSISKKEGGK